MSVELDHDPTKAQGLFCSPNGLPLVNFTGSFGCNTVGTHTVGATETNGSTILVFADQTVLVTEPSGAGCGINDIVFDITNATPPDDRRVLLSNTDLVPGTTTPAYPYPHYQSLLAKDKAIPVNMRVFADASPAAGVPVTLRIIDPPDPSEYIIGTPSWTGQPLPGTALSHVNDNIGPPPTFQGNCVPCATYSVTSGSDGFIQTELDLDANARAGDNYQVEATATLPSGATVTVRSGVITAWKRMFVEKKLMFRRGAPLATDAPAGVANLVVENVAISSTGDHFQNGDPILLLHAPPFGQPKNALNGFYQGLYQVAGHPHAFTANGPQPGPAGSSITTDGTTRIIGSHAHFNALNSGDVIGIGTDFRYVLSTQGTDVAFVDSAFSFVGTTATFTIGDPNLVDTSFHHYLRLPLDRALGESYLREPAIDPHTGLLVLNDGVAKLSTASLPPPSSDYFTASDDLLVGAAETQPANAFPSAYTEYIVLPWQPTVAAGAVVPRVPLIDNPTNPTTQRFIDKWFTLPVPQAVAASDPYRIATNPLTWYRYSTPPNHQLLLVADTDVTNIANAGTNGFLSLLSTGTSREMASVLVRGNTEHAVGDSSSPMFNAVVDTVLRRTTVHELTHQWQTNPGGHNDHCYPEVAYMSAAPYPQTVGPISPPAGIEFCLMAFADDSTSPPVPMMPAPWNPSLSLNMVQYFYRFGLTHYHVPSTANGFQSEYLAIRNASDPWHP